MALPYVLEDKYETWYWLEVQILTTDDISTSGMKLILLTFKGASVSLNALSISIKLAGDSAVYFKLNYIIIEKSETVDPSAMYLISANPFFPSQYLFLIPDL